MKKVLLVGVALSALCGCATTPVSTRDAKQVPADRLLAFQTADTDKTAIVTIIRDSGYVNGACYYGLWINKKMAARVDVAEMASFYIEPGEVLLRVGADPQAKGLCNMGQFVWKQYETIMKPREHKTFRLTSDANSNLDISRADIE